MKMREWSGGTISRLEVEDGVDKHEGIVSVGWRGNSENVHYGFDNTESKITTLVAMSTTVKKRKEMTGITAEEQQSCGSNASFQSTKVISSIIIIPFSKLSSHRSNAE